MSDEQDRLQDAASFVSFPMIARADVVQLAWLPRFGPSAQAAGDGLEPPRFRRAD
ncbi:hypothetical protein EDB85DRAFT_2156375 [Lactarius pseudohatsudake]|nr:hypothetical protein EDB85DRAFT_2156375 [Lactarius pseudohatsudake]